MILFTITVYRYTILPVDVIQQCRIVERLCSIPTQSQATVTNQTIC